MLVLKKRKAFTERRAVLRRHCNMGPLSQHLATALMRSPSLQSLSEQVFHGKRCVSAATAVEHGLLPKDVLSVDGEKVCASVM